MRYNKIFYIILGLGLFFIFKILLERDLFLINVQGRAEMLLVSHPSLGLNNFSSKPIDNSQILAVDGRVKSIDSNVSIPIKILSQQRKTSYTNSDGRFTFNLKPGIYTFFIVDENNAYLNSFDGKGYYKSYRVFSKIDNILITVNSKSYL